MALPHLNANIYLNKNTYAKRRDIDEQCRQQWSDKVKYFQQSNVQANKVNQWSSEKSFNNSIDAYKRQLSSRNSNDKSISFRKVKLTDLFEAERQQFQRELESRLLNNESSTSILKNRAEVLKSAREEERRKEAEKRFHEHFRLNNPDLRKVERDILNKDVSDFWPVQIQSKAKENLQIREEERKFEELENIKNKIAKEEEQHNFQKKVLKERYIKDSLRRQIEEIKCKEEESKCLKLKEAELLKSELELEEFHQRRTIINDAKARQDYGRILLRQHTTTMRRKSQQIQEELESDIQFLNYLANKDEEENEIQTIKKQTARQDIEWTREVMENQLKQERERELELDSIFADEASRLWSKREKEWDKEKLAREKLLVEVLNERKLQMQHKINKTRERQEESLKEREQLLREIEFDRQDMAKKNESARERKTEFRSTLDFQVNERKNDQLNEYYRIQNQLDEDLNAEKAYGQLLNEEAERMRSLGITPRVILK